MKKEEKEKKVSRMVSTEVLLSMSLSKKRSASEEMKVPETQAGGGPTNDKKIFITVGKSGTCLSTN